MIHHHLIYHSGKRILFLLATLLALPFLFLIVLRLLVAFEVVDELPSIQDLQSIENPIASELYANDTILIGRYYTENRSKLEPDQLNDFYKNALIATEDIRFYKHNGVDYRSLFRVFFKSILLQQKGSGGGSTITQQLVKNLYPRKHYKWFSIILNKFREMSIASRLENIYSKDQILLLYSNTVSFGEGAFGLNTAAKRFFNKDPKDLLLEEAATLVGLLKATTYYSPRRYPERAKQRRNVVLAQMADNNFIRDNVAEEVSKLPIKLSYQPLSQVEEFARYFKQYTKKEFDQWSSSLSKEDGSKYNIYRDGLKIYSSLDYDMQIVAEQNMQAHMSQLQKLFEDSWKGGRKYGKGTRIIDDKILADPYYKQLKEEGKTNKEALVEFTSHDMRKLWTWDGIEEKSSTRIDSIKHYLSLLHAGILAADPQTGKIKVYVGGNDYSRFQWDNILSPRQAGSVFKPIVYLTALEKGITPCDYYKNELRTYSDYQDWTPKNANEEYGGYIPVYQALTHSVNTISVQLLFEAGIPSVIEIAKELGIKSSLSQVPSIVLGTSDVSLYEMVAAYAVFANNGKAINLRTIEKIEDSHGNILFEDHSPEETFTDIDPENTEILNAMLSNVTKNGTGRRLYSNYSIPYEVMGKTGTTQNQSDGWFIGYTDNLVIGAWVGAQDRRIHFRNLSTGAGGRTALPLVGALFEYAASKGPHPTRPEIDTEFECLEFLSDEEYEFLQARNKDTDITDLYYRRKFYNQTNQHQSSSRQLTDEEKKLEKERQKRLKKYNRAKKKWERKLKRMKKKN